MKCEEEGYERETEQERYVETSKVEQRIKSAAKSV